MKVGYKVQFYPNQHTGEKFHTVLASMLYEGFFLTHLYRDTPGYASLLPWDENSVDSRDGNMFGWLLNDRYSQHIFSRRHWSLFQIHKNAILLLGAIKCHGVMLHSCDSFFQTDILWNHLPNQSTLIIFTHFIHSLSLIHRYSFVKTTSCFGLFIGCSCFALLYKLAWCCLPSILMAHLL